MGSSVENEYSALTCCGDSSDFSEVPGSCRAGLGCGWQWPVDLLVGLLSRARNGKCCAQAGAGQHCKAVAAGGSSARSHHIHLRWNCSAPTADAGGEIFVFGPPEGDIQVSVRFEVRPPTALRRGQRQPRGAPSIAVFVCTVVSSPGATWPAKRSAGPSPVGWQLRGATRRAQNALRTLIPPRESVRSEPDPRHERSSLTGQPSSRTSQEERRCFGSAWASSCLRREVSNSAAAARCSAAVLASASRVASRASALLPASASRTALSSSWRRAVTSSCNRAGNAEVQ